MAEQHSTQVNTAEISLAVFYRLDDCLREQERIAESIRFVLSLGNTTAPDRLPMLVSTLSVLHGVLTDRIETGIELLP
jgi:hypothetical protein